MVRYRNKEFVTARSPAFDLAQQWQNPVVLFILLLILSISGVLVIQGFQPGLPAIASLFVVDVSQSALNNSDWHPQAACDRYHNYLQLGDYQIDIWFAEQARVITQERVENSPSPDACNLNPEVLATHDLGHLPGTLLEHAIVQATQNVEYLRLQQQDMPVLVMLLLHETDSGVLAASSTENLTNSLQRLADVAHSIWLVGPTGKTATQLRQTFGPIENAHFCPLGTRYEQQLDKCFNQAFTTARTSIQ